MNPTDRYPKRWTKDLRGVWDFAFLGDIEPDTVDNHDISWNDVMTVPGCYDASPKYAAKRGLAAYRRSLRLPAAGLYRIVLDGVHHWCRLMVGGSPLVDHSGGFTRFSADYSADQAGTVELILLVDNRIDPERIPNHLDYFDWYHYGGVTRGIWMQKLPELHVDTFRVTTTDHLERRVDLRLEWSINEGASVGAGENVSLTVCFDGREILNESVAVTGGSGRIDRTVTVPDASLWSPASPKLYPFAAELGGDEVVAITGIRTVGTAGGQILLNGEPIRLVGFNRHEAHIQFGSAVPEQIILSDLQLIKEAGCNFLRGSHYPQDERTLELCDRLGIVVWSEATGWQHTADHLTDDRFLSAQELNIDEMIAVASNHPSVIMWGLLNESHSNVAESRAGYERLISRIRKGDPSRPVTYASNHPYDDLCLDLVDIVSLNCYPGWYVDSIEGIPAYVDAVLDHWDKNGHAHRPAILSEIGAGALPGFRDWNAARWSEEYQARLLSRVVDYFLGQPRLSGLALWQFCDIRASESVSRALGRPRGYNNKGVVDEYRRPKLGYDAVKALLKERVQGVR